LIKNETLIIKLDSVQYFVLWNVVVYCTGQVIYNSWYFLLRTLQSIKKKINASFNNYAVNNTSDNIGEEIHSE